MMNGVIGQQYSWVALTGMYYMYGDAMCILVVSKCVCVCGGGGVSAPSLASGGDCMCMYMLLA